MFEMNIKEIVKEKIENTRKKLKDASVSSFITEVEALLRYSVDHSKTTDGIDGECHAAYSAVIDFLFEWGYEAAAFQLLIRWWNHLAENQKKQGKHLYRASAAYMLAKKYQKTGDNGAAFRWALLAHADDVLEQGIEAKGGARQWLEAVMGLGESFIDKFSASASFDKNAGHDGNVKDVYAENALVNFIKKEPKLAHFLAKGAQVEQFPLTPAYFDTLIRDMDGEQNDETASEVGEDGERNNETASKVGDKLEFLATYLFLLIPGWIPIRNFMPRDSSFEHDIVVTNLNQSENLYTDLFGRQFLVECKNWESNVGVNHVGYFLYRMRLTHCKFGIIFTNKHITGTKKDSSIAAVALIQRAFHEDGIICINISLDDLKNLKETSFLTLLMEKRNEVMFGMPK